MSFALSFYGLGGAIQSPDMLPLLIGPPGQGAGGIPGGIDNSLLSDMATATFKGRIAAVTGAPQDLTATQATSLLNVATVSLKGLMSASDFAKLAGIANGATANTGTVTSVAITAPTGFEVSGSPITASGTLALAFASGYSLPTTAKQTEWDTAFSQTRQWGGGSTGLVAATGRASLGATTIGGSLFTLANPGAVTFPRFNADNTVTALSASDMRTALGAGTGSVTTVSVVTANGVSGSVANATSTPAITITLGAITPDSVAASGNVTGANLSGTNTGDQTTITGNAGTATTLQTGRTISITGDATWTSGTFNGSANVTAALTLATVNSNVGSFGSNAAVPVITVNGKGLVTAVSTAALGTAATQNTGTSGGTIPLLNGSNTFSGTTVLNTCRLGGAVTTNAAVGNAVLISGEIMSCGPLAGAFFEDRSLTVASGANWYGFYATGGVIYLYNGGANIGSFNSSTGAYTALSDEQRKENKAFSPYGLNHVLQLQTYTYRVKGSPENAPLDLGLMAGDVKSIIPPAYTETVFTDHDGNPQKFIGLNQMPLVAALIEAVKTLHERVAALEAALSP